MSEPKDDPVAPFARAVLELFREDLRKVRFPDLDAESLASAAEELKAAQLEVECVEQALLGAREVVRERERLLNAQAARGLSYARIFASGNLQLGARIAQIDLLAPESAGTPAAASKKRGRARKESVGAELFANEDMKEGTEEEAAA
jgi:SpoVK/Ycf46/Vps4 family AAA+-type ATPase